MKSGRKFGCDRKSVVVPKRVEYVDLPQRNVGVITIDMVEDADNPIIEGEDFQTGSVVKIVQKYLYGDDGRANDVLEAVLERANERARYIRPPEKIVVRQGLLENGIEVDQAPIELFNEWTNQFDFDNKPFTKKQAVDLMLEALQDIEFTKKVHIADFVVREIHVQNFMPFGGENSVKSIPDGIISICGEYDGQDGRSNRAGKSSLMDAALYCLTGVCRDMLKDEYMYGYPHHGDALTKVQTVIQIANKPNLVNIERAISSKCGWLKIDKGVSNLDQVTDLIKISKQEFLKTCYVQQGDLDIVLSQTSAKLKDDISGWKSIDDWKIVEKWFANHDRSTMIKIDGLNNMTELAKKRLDNSSLPSKKYIKNLEENLKVLTDDYADLKHSHDRLGQLTKQLENDKTVERYEKIINELGSVSEKHEKLKTQVGKIKKRFDIAKERKTTKVNEINDCKNLIGNGFSGNCPVDDKRCPRTTKINSDRLALKDKLKDLRFDFDGEISTDYNELKRLYNKKNDAFEVAGDQLKEIKSYKTIIDELKDPDFDPIVAEHEIMKLSKIDITKIGGEMMECQDELAEAKIARASYKQAKDDIKLAKKEKNRLDKMMYLYGFCRRAVSSSGIPHLIIKTALDEIEGQTNLILEKLGTDHRILFKTDYELASKSLTDYCYFCNYAYPLKKTKVCPECGEKRSRKKSDKVKVMVTEGGDIHSIGADSGAGKSLLALAMRISVSRLIGAKVLFFDEIGGSLDDYNRSMLIKLIHMLPDLGFKQVFLISHQHEISESISNRIVVTRNQSECRSSLSSDGWECR